MGAAANGPLAGLKIIEMAGLGPVPLAGLMLAELGARVVRVERLSRGRAFLELPAQYDLDRHGRETVCLDLKRPEGMDTLRRMAAAADCLIEGFRPGVMERLGLAPDAALEANPRLIYGRMTGFGQDGPLAQRAGHDLTYIAWSGVLHAIGHAGGRPVPPLNLVGDYGGGTMFLLVGLLAALVERGISGRGQVVDAAMVDGSAMLAAPFAGFMASGIWRDRRGSNLLDSGTPFYDTYETTDGLHVAVACLEPQFFAEFARLLPLRPELAAAQYDRARWPAMRDEIAARIRQRSRDEWTAIFAGSDACVAPVLSLAEAPDSEHAKARSAYADISGMRRPRPAPRFSRSQASVSGGTIDDAAASLAAFGFSAAEFDALASSGVVGR